MVKFYTEIVTYDNKKFYKLFCYEGKKYNYELFKIRVGGGIKGC